MIKNLKFSELQYKFTIVIKRDPYFFWIRSRCVSDNARNMHCKIDTLMARAKKSSLQRNFVYFGTHCCPLVCLGCFFSTRNCVN